MERNRQPRRRNGEPTEAAVDVDRALPQRAMFELQVDGVETSDCLADVLDVFVGQIADPPMGAAQQVLVEIEHGYIERLAQLLP